MARVTVRIPTLLTQFADGQQTVDVEADTVDGAIEALLTAHPDLETHLFARRRQLRPHLRLFLNEEDVAWLDAEDPPLADGDEVTVLQAVSGG